MIVFFRKLKSVYGHKPIRTLCSAGLLAIMLMSIFSYGYVKLENVSWVEGLWQAWQTFTTVGYGNAPAASTGGRLFTILVGTVGIGTLAIIIAAGSDLRQYFKERKRLGFMRVNTEHYLIINYPGADKRIR